jgi:hypothetical protein
MSKLKGKMNSPIKVGLAKWTLRIFCIILLLETGLLVILYFIQDAVIFPGARPKGSPPRQLIVPPDIEKLSLMTAAGNKVAAFFASALTS